MRKREEVAQPGSCLSRAAMDEPLFVLRANDPLAADTVRTWAGRYKRQKESESGVQLTVDQHQKYSEAVRTASSMDEWQKVRQSG